MAWSLTHKRQMRGSGVVVEMCVDSCASAEAAQRAGACRIELCSALELGGLTPSSGLISTVRRAVSIPLHILIRPRAGDFRYSAQDLLVMREDVVSSARLGADGVVLGVLTRNGDVDVAQLCEFVQLCKEQGLSLTFHRAFDMVRDQRAALEALISCGIRRVLTSGGSHTALQGSTAIAQLVQQAEGRIAVMAGGGVRAQNVARTVQLTGVSEVHSSAARLEDSDMLYKSRKLALCARQPPSDWSWPALDEDAAAALCAACRRIQDAEHVSGAWQCLTFRG